MRLIRNMLDTTLSWKIVLSLHSQDDHVPDMHKFPRDMWKLSCHGLLE